jgi:uncharacterized membrane protein
MVMKFSWRTEVFSWSVIAAMFAAAAWAWSRVPDQIPVHWNAAGQVDGYGSRFMGLLLIPLITLGMHLLFMVLPAIDPCRTSDDGFARVYAIFRSAILAFMGAVYAATTLVALGHRVDVTRVITVALGLLFVVLGWYLREVRPNWFVGVRTPWTLSSRLSWTKTHQLAGRLFVASGAVTLLCGIVLPAWGVFVMLGTILPSALAMTAYSYMVWRDDPERTPPSDGE